MNGCMNWLIRIGGLVVLAALAACKSPRPAATELGLDASGSIQIKIVGDVNHPGIYLVSSTTSLANLPNIAGGWTGHGEFGASPSKAIVKNPADKQTRERIYHLKKLSREEQEAVLFRDGDEVYFPRLLW